MPNSKFLDNIRSITGIDNLQTDSNFKNVEIKDIIYFINTSLLFDDEEKIQLKALVVSANGLNNKVLDILFSRFISNEIDLIERTLKMLEDKTKNKLEEIEYPMIRESMRSRLQRLSALKNSSEIFNTPISIKPY